MSIKTNSLMKFSEFYRLLEANGWTIKKGTNHYKYVHPDFDYFIPVENPSGVF